MSGRCLHGDSQGKTSDVEIKNRSAITAMGGTNLLDWLEKNHFDEAGAEFILKVAENNVGPVLLCQCHASRRRLQRQVSFRTSRKLPTCYLLCRIIIEPNVQAGQPDAYEQQLNSKNDDMSRKLFKRVKQQD